MTDSVQESRMLPVLFHWRALPALMNVVHSEARD